MPVTSLQRRNRLIRCINAAAIPTGMPPRPPSRRAAAPSETPPPPQSSQSASRPEPEGPPGQREQVTNRTLYDRSSSERPVASSSPWSCVSQRSCGSRCRTTPCPLSARRLGGRPSGEPPRTEIWGNRTASGRRRTRFCFSSLACL